jgi:hypothetical protein
MRDFALEVYFSQWEFAAKYNLAGSDVGFGRSRVPSGIAVLRAWLEAQKIPARVGAAGGIS